MNKDIDELTLLNRDYVASVQNSDVKRFDEILAQDFYCTNPDKTLVDRAAFLRQTAIPVKIKNLAAEDVKISRARRLRRYPRAYQLRHARRPTGLWPLYRLLGPAERPLARGVGACGAVTPTYASNIITLRTVLPAFIAAKPSLISESFSLAEIQSSRCSLPRI